jgi:hypothetical protein
MKKTALGIVLITVIALSTAAWFVQNQISELQTRISGLQAQNREQQDRLTDFTYELAKVRHLRVEITAFSWLGGFNPIVGVTLVHPVNVTVQNNDVVPLSGLTFTVRLLKKDLGTPIGTEGSTRINKLNLDESRVIDGGAYTTIGTSLDNTVCAVTLSLGDTVLDEWTQSLS